MRWFLMAAAVAALLGLASGREASVPSAATAGERLVAVIPAAVSVATVGSASGTRSGGRIAFVSDLSPAALRMGGRVSAGRLFVVGPGGGRVDLSGDLDGGSDSVAWLSPDGRTIAFLRRQGDAASAESAALWVRSVSAGAPRRLLTPDPKESFSLGFGEVASGSTSWSPDGTKLAISAVSTAYCLPGYTKCAAWYTVITDLAGRRLSTVGGLDAVWSPNGRYLAVGSGLFSLEDPQEWTVEIVRADGEDGPDLRLRKRPQATWDSWTWAPDGSRLTVEECIGDWNCRVHVVRTRDWREQALLPGTGAIWSPDGSRLVHFTRSGGVWSADVFDRNGRRLWSLGPGVGAVGWSATGARLAYTRVTKGRTSLSLARRDGSGARRIATGLAAVEDLRWSPDGGRIVFVSTRNEGASSLVTVAPATGHATPLLRDVAGGYIGVLGWTPGGAVAIHRRVSSLRLELWTMLPDGTGLRRVTANGVEEHDPSWSPDGKRLAFWRDDPAQRKRPESMAVYVVAARGGPARKVVGGPRGSYASHPDWSPDGRRLLFTRWPTERNRGGISVVGLDGRNAHVVIPGEAQPAAWSPDGRQITFFDGRGISISTADGKQRRLVFDAPGNAFCGRPTWAPDGLRLAFYCAQLGLATIGTDGTGLRVLDTTAETAPAADTAPTWSPDGKTIAYTKEVQDAFGERASRLVFIPAAGGAATVMDIRGATVSRPDWTR